MTQERERSGSTDVVLYDDGGYGVHFSMTSCGIGISHSRLSACSYTSKACDAGA
jgi:hypothetical protein